MLQALPPYQKESTPSHEKKRKRTRAAWAQRPWPSRQAGKEENGGLYYKTLKEGQIALPPRRNFQAYLLLRKGERPDPERKPCR